MELEVRACSNISGHREAATTCWMEQTSIIRIEANAKKQLNISFDLEHKHHKELLFLNLVGVSGFSAEFFCFM